MSTLGRIHDYSLLFCHSIPSILTDLMIKSGGSNYPYMDAEAGQLTVKDVEKLLSVYKDVVTNYTRLCKAIRDVPVIEKVRPTLKLEGTDKPPAAEASRSDDQKIGN